MEEFLKKQKLEKIEDLPNGLFKCKDQEGKIVVVKKARGHECAMAKLVTSLAEDYNGKFIKLELPCYIFAENGFLIMPFYEGRTYNELWAESSYGGPRMGIELSKEMAQMIYDFSKIDVSKAEEILKQLGIDKIKFDFEEWLLDFLKKAHNLVSEKCLSQEDVVKAEKILEKVKRQGRFIFNNGDYYPRNLIKGDKVVIIDWQTWNENYRANIIDTIENVAAFAFIHMWANTVWQVNFLKELRKFFRINFKKFRTAVLIKSFDQGIFFGSGKLRNDQFSLFRDFLDTQKLKELEVKTRPSLIVRILRPLLNIFR